MFRRCWACSKVLYFTLVDWQLSATRMSRHVLYKMPIPPPRWPVLRGMWDILYPSGQTSPMICLANKSSQGSHVSVTAIMSQSCSTMWSFSLIPFLFNDLQLITANKRDFSTTLGREWGWIRIKLFVLIPLWRGEDSRSRCVMTVEMGLFWLISRSLTFEGNNGECSDRDEIGMQIWLLWCTDWIFDEPSRFRNFKALPARQPRKVRKIPQSRSRLKTVWAMGVRLNGFLRRRSSPGRYSKRAVSRFASVIWPHGKLVMDDNQFRWPIKV